MLKKLITSAIENGFYWKQYTKIHRKIIISYSNLKYMEWYNGNLKSDWAENSFF